MFVTLEMMRIVFLQRHVNKSKSHLMQYPDTYNEIALFDFNVIQDFLIRLKGKNRVVIFIQALLVC